MAYETRRVTVRDTPQDLSVLAGLVEGEKYVVFNESAATRIFFADAMTQPAADGAALPLKPGDSQEANLSAPLKLWVWCEAGEEGRLIVGGTQ